MHVHNYVDTSIYYIYIIDIYVCNSSYVYITHVCSSMHCNVHMYVCMYYVCIHISLISMLFVVVTLSISTCSLLHMLILLLHMFVVVTTRFQWRTRASAVKYAIRH